MRYIKQDDFDDFKCIAGDCPSSCCCGWQIVIDENSMEKYVSFEGNMAERINHAIDFTEGVFIQNQRRCAMLNEDYLCDLQLMAGESFLCETCRKFPRHEEEFEGVREWSLSLSCPKVADMVVNRKNKIEFVEYETDEEDDFEEFDYLLYTKLCDARDVIYKIAQNRGKSIENRCERILKFAFELQKCVDEDSIFDMDDLIIRAEKSNEIKNEFGANEIVVKNIEILNHLEQLQEDWQEILFSMEEFIKKGEKIILSDDEIITAENVLVLLIYTYFCGAVYDGWIFSKAKLCVESMYFIMLAYKSTNLTLQEAIYKYSKEVEHSDLNLDMLEEYFSQLKE